MRARIVLLLIFVTGLWCLVLGRAAFLQLLPNDRLKSLQKRQFETVVTLNARRGDVIDRNKNELAVSMSVYSLFADPKIIEEPHKVARMLAKELKVPYKQVDEKLRSRKKRFVWIERTLPKNVRDTIVDMKIRGLGFIEESERIYPNDKLLAQVLGFVGEGGQGLEGLELKYNEHLQAEHKKVSMRRDARGRPLIVNGQIFNQVPDGADVQLTIDRELQFILEQELAGTVREHEADAAVGVVLDAQTSEILAMASSPTFDPNHAGDFSPEKRRNRAVTDSFEPGSTMKTFLIAGALAAGIVEPNTRINTEGGTLKIGKRTIHESDAHHRFDSLTVSEILAVSSNIGAAKIGFKMGQDRLSAAYRSFGFGERTGVDLPGEQRGIMQPFPWREHLLANIAFGHGMTTTALQVANAYAVIANGGWLKQPYIVKSIRDHESGEIIDSKPRTLRRVLNDPEVAKMRQMLLGVTTTDLGTGANARVPGYPVAGKTGTAQKVNPNGRGYLKGGYVSSFAGFLPANDPRFVIYIAVDHPRKEFYGAAVAAPVFANIAKFAVRRSGLPPLMLGEESNSTKARRALALAASGAAPGDSAASISAKALAPILPKAALSVEPPRLADVGSAKVLIASESSLKSGAGSAAAALAEAQPSVSVVPDLTGLTLREVLGRINGSGVTVRVQGQGFVTHTSPPQGARLSDNKDLTVYLTK